MCFISVINIKNLIFIAFCQNCDEKYNIGRIIAILIDILMTKKYKVTFKTEKEISIERKLFIRYILRYITG